MSTTPPAAATLSSSDNVDAVLEDTASLLASLGLDQDDSDSDDADDHNDREDIVFDEEEQVFEIDNGNGYKTINIDRDEARRILWSEFPLLIVFGALCTCLAFSLLIQAHSGGGSDDRLTVYDDTYLVDPSNDAQKVYLQKLNETLLMGATQQGKHPKQPQYCYDMDDDPEQVDLDSCTCTSPWQPTPRPDPKHPDTGVVYDQWETFHQHLVKEARKVPSQDPVLDVLMLGDSITERRMGTKNLNKAAVPDFKDVHDQYFDKSQGAQLQGIPLGAGGDTSYELLWQIQHGVLSKNLHPRAILLLIGSNDIGDRAGCSKRNALAGILNVANYLHQHRPDAKFILHALPPLTDGYRDEKYTLGLKYEKVKWINAELEKYCNMNPYQWHFLDNSDLFLAKNPRSDERHHVPATAINSTVMWDGHHPTQIGYELWNERLIPQIIKILEE